MTPELLASDSFQRLISGSGKSVVEFHADWCVDCKRLAPSMPEIVEQFKDDFAFGSIDVEAEKEIAEKYNVLGIPTFIVFQNGKEVGRLPSRFAKTKEQVTSFLASNR